MNGKVKFFNCRAGFGFVTSDELPGEDLFCHVSDVLLPKNEYLQQDQEVTFDLRVDEQGRACATHVRRVLGQERVDRPSPDLGVDTGRPYIPYPGQPRQYADRKTSEFDPGRAWRL